MTRNYFRALILILLVSVILCGCSNNNADVSSQTETSQIDLSMYDTERIVDYLLANRCSDVMNYLEEIEYDFSFADEYYVCDNCKQLYRYYPGDTSKDYCFNCVDKFSNTCCFCGATWTENEMLSSFYVDGQEYYMCPECVSDYFENIESMEPCYYCIGCGHLTKCGKYIHSWTQCNLCDKCVLEYVKCPKCGLYTEELEDDGTCGMCDLIIN